MTEPAASPAPLSESQDEWYEREKAAFIAWWESGKREKFSENPTIAAGAGWLARAEATTPNRADVLEDLRRIAKIGPDAWGPPEDVQLVCLEAAVLLELRELQRNGE